MDYKLIGLIGEKKWWDFAKVKTNAKGKNVATFELSNLEKLVELCKKQEEFRGKKYINLYLKDNIPKPADSHTVEKGNAYQPQPDDDEIIPF